MATQVLSPDISVPGGSNPWKPVCQKHRLAYSSCEAKCYRGQVLIISDRYSPTPYSIAGAVLTLYVYDQITHLWYTFDTKHRDFRTSATRFPNLSQPTTLLVDTERNIEHSGMSEIELLISLHSRRTCLLCNAPEVIQYEALCERYFTEGRKCEKCGAHRHVQFEISKAHSE